jgi:N-acetylhexosamine 1-kinase
MPARNVHNDAKGPNCVRATRGGARTIIDLDTTMPGLLLADVGELVRSSTRALTEHPPQVVMAQIEAVNRGFLAGYRSPLTDAEQAGMLLAGPLLTTENAARFLSDHLSGDKYYGAAEPDQNLHRANAQQRVAMAQIEAIEYTLSGGPADSA